MMLTMMDFWLLGRLEKFANWWHKLTGKNCFWLAKIFTLFGMICLVCWMTVVYFVYHDMNFKLGKHILLIIHSLLFLEIVFVLCAIKVTEMRIAETQELDLSNPSKHIEQSERIWRMVSYPIYSFVWAVAIYYVYRFSLTVAVLCASAYIWIVIAWYFMCCDPLPPSKSRAKEWKEKFVNAVKWVFAHAPRPSPAHCE